MTATTTKPATKPAKAANLAPTTKAHEANGKQHKVRTAPDGLRKDQIRVLSILAAAKNPLTAAVIAEKCLQATGNGAHAVSLGYSFGRVDADKDAAFRAKFGPTLISLGYAKRTTIGGGDTDIAETTAYLITASGRKALEKAKTAAK